MHKSFELKISYTLNEVDVVARNILDHANCKTLLFYGDMGVGKTTLIKSIVRELNSTDKVTSPTFSIVNEYQSKDRNIIYHFDLYRIKSLEEAFNLGLEEYLDSNNYKLIEWPNKICIEQVLANKFESVYIKKDLSEDKRIIEIK